MTILINKKKIITFCIIGLCLCLSYSCSNKNKTATISLADADSVMNPKYATGYDVKDSAGVRLVNVGKDYHFALVATDDAAVPDDYTKVRVHAHLIIS